MFGKLFTKEIASLAQIVINGIKTKILIKINAKRIKVTAQTLGIYFSILFIIGLIAHVITNEPNNISKISSEKIDNAITPRIKTKTIIFFKLKIFVLSKLNSLQ